MPLIVVERAPEVEPRRFYVLSADIEAHGHTGGCLGCAALVSHGRATKPHSDECRERTRTIIETTLTGKARMNAYKDRIAESERVKERKEFELSEVQEMCLWNPGTEMMSTRRFDMRTHLAVTSQKTSTTGKNRNERRPRWQRRIRGSEWRTTGQVEEDSTIRARSSECSVAFRPRCVSGVSCEW